MSLSSLSERMQSKRLADKAAVRDQKEGSMALILRRSLEHSGQATVPQQKDKGQFVLIKHGMLDGYIILEGHMTQQNWLLNPGMAVWIPPRHLHWARPVCEIELIVLYMPAESCRSLPQTAHPITATPLMTALCDGLLEASRSPQSLERGRRMLKLLIDEIADAPVAPLALPLPRDSRLKRLTDALLADPACRLSLADWGRRVGATERTLARLFRRETGFSYTEWHGRLLLREAMRGLLNGSSNSQLAEDLGFASTCSFGHWFRRTAGNTPGFFREQFDAGRSDL